MLCFAMCCSVLNCFAMTRHEFPCFARLTMLRHALLLYDIALLCSAMFSFAMPCHARICFAMFGSASIGYALLMLLHICFDLLSYAMLTYTIICCAIMWFDMLGYAWLCYALLCFPLLCFHFEAGPSPFPRPARKCEKFMWFMRRLDPSRNSSQISRNLGASTNPDWGIGQTNLANLIHISDVQTASS